MGDDFFADDVEEVVEEEAEEDEAKKMYEEISGESTQGESYEGESSESLEEGDIEEKDKAFVEEIWGEMDEEGEEEEEEQELEKAQVVEEEEEEGYEEEPPPDPAAPYNLSDSSEALKAPFKLNEEQMDEVADLWQQYQDYTPVYTDIKDYVTEVELVYMLKSLNLMTFTPEQLQELIEYCVRPAHPKNFVNFDQFVHMVTIRQRDMPEEEEIRLALEVFDPKKTGIIEREYFREIIAEHGNRKIKNVDAFIKEVDMTNDGTLGLEDIVGTICIDLNRDDIQMIYDQIYPPEEKPDNIDELVAVHDPNTALYQQ